MVKNLPSYGIGKARQTACFGHVHELITAVYVVAGSYTGAISERFTEIEEVCPKVGFAALA